MYTYPFIQHIFIMTPGDFIIIIIIEIWLHL